MILRHSTTRRALQSILGVGLDPARAVDRRRAVWLHAAGRTPWAVVHTVRRHGGRVQDVVTISVDVPRGWLRRHQRGLWYCARLIPPERFGRIIEFGEVSASPVHSGE